MWLFCLLFHLASLPPSTPYASIISEEDHREELPTFDPEATFEGDILVRSDSHGGEEVRDAHLAQPDRLWPSGIVEYKFYRTFPRKHKIMVKKAMRYISNRTSCVTFLPGTSSSLNYVTIAPGPDCSSELGMRGGEQLLYLNSRCFDTGLIVPVHELMHMLGFVHEHNRTLVFGPLKIHPDFLKTWDRHLHFHGTFFVV